MDVVATYESYCNFLDLLDDAHDTYIGYGAEAAVSDSSGRTDNQDRKRKDFAKGNGLIAAVVALFDGLFTALRKLFGVDSDKELEESGEFIVPNGINVDPNKILSLAIDKCHVLSRCEKGTNEYNTALEELKQLYEAYKKQVAKIKETAQNMKDMNKAQSIGWKAISLVPFTQANKAKQAAKSMAKSGKNGDEVLRWLSDILSVHTDLSKTMKSHGWFRRKTNKYAKKAIRYGKKVDKNLQGYESVTNVVNFIE